MRRSPANFNRRRQALLPPGSGFRFGRSLAPALLGLVCLIAAALCPAVALAADLPPAIQSLRPLFAGSYKQGFWSPFEVTLAGGSESTIGRLELEVKDGDGVSTIVSTPGDRPVQLASGQSTSVIVYAKIGAPPDAAVTVRLGVPGRRPIEEEFYPGAGGDIPFALDATQPLLLDLGGKLLLPPRDQNAPPSQATVIAHLAGVEQLCPRWQGYEGVESIVIFSSRPELLRGLTPESARWKALDTWVRQGGRLVLCVARSADETLAPGGPLAGFAPGRLAGRVSLKQTTAWETYAEASDPLPVVPNERDQPARLEAPRLADVQGVVEAYEGARPSDLPLVVRAPRGFGEVVFVAADLDRPPFTRWAGARALWDKLLRRPKPVDETQANQGQVAWVGFDDLAGQLRGALDQFAGVSVPFALVVFLIVVYIGCIGPLDYFVLKRYVRRMEWTWFTFPAIVVAFSLGAYVLARHLKGEESRLNQVDLVDVDVSSGLVRGGMWSVLFSPQTEAYNLSVEPFLPRTASGEAAPREAAATNASQPADSAATAAGGLEPARAEILLSWFGLPGRGYGGMARQTPAAGLFESAYFFGPECATLEGLPVAVWSTKALTARWTATSPDLMTGRLRDAGDQLLKGQIENRSELRLSDAAVLYDRWAYPIGPLAPGQTLRFDERSDPQAIETFFNRGSQEDGHNVVQQYLGESLDLKAIMNAILFHESVGGARYTQLSHAYLGNLDATPQLRNGRAVLIGRSDASPLRLLRDGQPLAGPKDQHWVYYRFMLPVDKERK